MKSIGLLFLMIILFSCDEGCDDVFKSYGVRVEGQGIQEVYTVRTATNDTINRMTEVTQDTSVFMVAGDDLEGQLGSEGEPFIFHIKAQDSLLMTYDYVFRDGECHVEKQSGPTEISF